MFLVFWCLDVGLTSSEVCPGGEGEGGEGEAGSSMLGPVCQGQGSSYQAVQTTRHWGPSHPFTVILCGDCGLEAGLALVSAGGVQGVSHPDLCGEGLGDWEVKGGGLNRDR